ncbi:Vacuolar protein sorting associated protein 72 [Fasciola gigantica]|uniref:Vacuolar protein sorting associated protein 72 n=1 Tax=Fasciola gigantica TaxID=46835 RepID=A0A504YMF9_FASGI|nr:Vacuolar protein sorting associated protein 72 [Fasciola gigantica]
MKAFKNPEDPNSRLNEDDFYIIGFFTLTDFNERHANLIYLYSSSTIRAAPIIADRDARCSRNLITFADSATLRAAMPRTATPLPEPSAVAPAPPVPRPRRRMRICPITGLPARYLDPITLTPYANLAAFRVLRRLYAIHLETNVAPIDLLREYRSGNIPVDAT